MAQVPTMHKSIPASMEEKIHFRLLRIGKASDCLLAQREMARRAGNSPGKENSCHAALLKNGLPGAPLQTQRDIIGLCLLDNTSRTGRKAETGVFLLGTKASEVRKLGEEDCGTAKRISGLEVCLRTAI